MPQIESANIQINRVVFSVQNDARVVGAWRSIGDAQGYAAKQTNQFMRQARRVIGATIAFAAFAKTVQLVGKAVSGLVTVPAQFELIEAQLRRLSSSAEEAAEDINFLIVESLATPFELKDIMEATVTIKAFSLDVQRFLPIVLDWAAGMNRGVQDMAASFGKIASGSKQIQRILPTRGFEYKDFIRAFGQVGDRAVAMAGLIEQKFGGMRIIMADTFKGIISNVHEAIAFIQRRLGIQLFQFVRMRVKQLFDWLTAILGTGGEELDTWAEHFVSAAISIEIMVKKLAGVFASLWNTLVDIFNQLPEVVREKAPLALMVTLFRRAAFWAMKFATVLALIQDLLSGQLMRVLKGAAGGLGLGISVGLEKLFGLFGAEGFQETMQRGHIDPILEWLRDLNLEGTAVGRLMSGILDTIIAIGSGEWWEDFGEQVKLTKIQLEEFMRFMGLTPIGTEGTRATMGFVDALKEWQSKTSDFLNYDFWRNAVNSMSNAFISGFERMTMAVIRNTNNLAQAIKSFFTTVVDEIIRQLARLAGFHALRWILGMAGIPIPDPNAIVAAQAVATTTPGGGPLGAGAMVAPAGVNYNFYAPVYGWDDFRKKVSEADRDNARGRA